MRFVLIILLILVANAHATITRVQTATGSTGGTTNSTLTVAVSALTAGNWLVVGIGSNTASARSYTVVPTAITDLIGGPEAASFDSTGAMQCVVNLYYIVVGGATTITITGPAATQTVAVVAEYSGVNFMPDLWNLATGVGTTATAGATSTTNYPNELMVGVIVSKLQVNTPNTSWVTGGSATNGFTIVPNSQTSTSTNSATNNDRCIVLCDKQVTTTGTADVSVSITAGSQRYAGAIFTLREVPQVVSRMGGD